MESFQAHLTVCLLGVPATSKKMMETNADFDKNRKNS